MSEGKNLGAGAGFVFTMNIVIGTGFLGLPYAFQETGILLSLIYLALVSALNNYLSLMFLEVIHKAHLLKISEEEGIPFYLNARDIILHSKKSVTVAENTERLQSINERKIDASSAMSIIFGRKFGILYLLLLTIYFESILVTYTSVFGSSLAWSIPLLSTDTCDIYSSAFYSPCIYNYWIFLSIYSVIVIYLSVRGLKKQMNFQLVMCGMRFVIMSLVIICSLDLGVNNNPVAPGSPSPSAHSPVMFNFKNSGVTLPILFFSLAYQLHLPSIAEVIEDKGKNLWTIVTAVTFTSMFWYAALGSVVPYAIDNVDKQSTLSFREYSAGNVESRLWWTEFIAFVILLFPAFDMISSFPLVCISLADNWICMVYGNQEISHRRIVGFRLGLGLIGLAVAAFLYNIV